jgi:hypothetical protein
MKPTTGISNKKALFHFPFMRGANNPPTINIKAGGTVLIIVILSPHHQGAQNVFCRNNQGHTGYKTEDAIEFGPPFPGKMRVFVGKYLKNKENTQ